MCKEYDSNRATLANLIYSRSSFTEQEIVDAYRNERDGQTMVDFRLSVVGYLRQLSELGALRYSAGRYEVIVDQPEHSPA